MSERPATRTRGAPSGSTYLYPPGYRYHGGVTTRRTVLAALTGLIAAACSPAATKTPGALPPNGAELGVAAFAGALQLPGVVVLDVRTPQEYADGHLERASNIDVSAADFSARIAKLDPAVPYAVYCRSGNRSATALGILRKAGFTSTFHLGGGIGAWTAAGRSVVKG